jgi:hypothetical protein
VNPDSESAEQSKEIRMGLIHLIDDQGSISDGAVMKHTSTEIPECKEGNLIFMPALPSPSLVSLQYEIDSSDIGYHFDVW